jgi:hypothetical protein
VPVKNNPVPGLFDPADQTPLALGFRSAFVAGAPALGAAGLSEIRMTLGNGFDAGESILAGRAQTDYASVTLSGDRGEFMKEISESVASLASACPPSDPLTAESILARATAQTCAGCHAIEPPTPEGTPIGCGLTWPRSLGGAHIDELGALSPALSDVFLPRRAEVMTTYLRGCDVEAMMGNLQPVLSGGDTLPD